MHVLTMVMQQLESHGMKHIDKLFEKDVDIMDFANIYVDKILKVSLNSRDTFDINDLKAAWIAGWNARYKYETR